MNTVNAERKLVDKLVEECTENVDEVKIAIITLAEYENEHENYCKSSCKLFIVLFSINANTWILMKKETFIQDCWKETKNRKETLVFIISDMLWLKDFMILKVLAV